MRVDLGKLSRWLVLSALVYAPWAYGCTPPGTVWVLNAWLGVAGVLWVVKCWQQRVRPQVHPVLAAGAGWLAIQGFLMTLAGADVSVAPSSEPGLWAGTWRVALILCAACQACDMARHTHWRRRLWGAMALAGLSIALFGLGQRFLNAPGIFWDYENNWAGTFFATFHYHGTAGAYINLIWPFVAGLLAASFLKRDNLKARAFWLMALAACLAAVAVNTSRASNLVAAVLLGLMLAGAASYWFWGDHPGPRQPAFVAAVLLLGIIVVGLADFVGLDRTLDRWKLHGLGLSWHNPRVQVAQRCLGLLPEAGIFGFGPGSFHHVFAARTAWAGSMDGSSSWTHAHQDYLQTVIEWGFLGALAWATLFAGALAHSIRVRWERRGQWSRRDRILHSAILASLAGVAMHGLVDYPMQVASLQLYACVMMGMLWSARHWMGRVERRSD